MDILVSSKSWNAWFPLGRQWCHIRPKELMESLVATGQYQLSNFDADILDLFAAAYADEAETKVQRSRGLWRPENIEDPHTAVASADVYRKIPDSNQGILLKQSDCLCNKSLQIPCCSSRSGDRRDRSRWISKHWAKLHTLSGVLRATGCRAALKLHRFAIMQAWQPKTCKQPSKTTRTLIFL